LCAPLIIAACGFFGGSFLAGATFFAGAIFLAGATFFAAAFFAGAFLAAGFFAGDFFATTFFATGLLFALDFLPANRATAFDNFFFNGTAPKAKG
jgi:hypothetical protein